jgi:hypothetical protein
MRLALVFAANRVASIKRARQGASLDPVPNYSLSLAGKPPQLRGLRTTKRIAPTATSRQYAPNSLRFALPPGSSGSSRRSVDQPAITHGKSRSHHRHAETRYGERAAIGMQPMRTASVADHTRGGRSMSDR